jgi:hypothetical protein
MLPRVILEEKEPCSRLNYLLLSNFAFTERKKGQLTSPKIGSYIDPGRQYVWPKTNFISTFDKMFDKNAGPTHNWYLKEIILKVSIVIFEERIDDAQQRVHGGTGKY